MSSGPRRVIGGRVTGTWSADVRRVQAVDRRGVRARARRRALARAVVARLHRRAVLLHPAGDLLAETAVAAHSAATAELDVVQFALLHQLLEPCERHRLVGAGEAPHGDDRFVRAEDQLAGTLRIGHREQPLGAVLVLLQVRDQLAVDAAAHAAPAAGAPSRGTGAAGSRAAAREFPVRAAGRAALREFTGAATGLHLTAAVAAVAAGDLPARLAAPLGAVLAATGATAVAAEAPAAPAAGTAHPATGRRTRRRVGAAHTAGGGG